MSVQVKLKFRGAKKIIFWEELEEKEPGKGTEKEFWNRLFGGYRLPICPACKEDLRLESMHIEKSISGYAVFGGSPRSSSPALQQGADDIEVEFSCPKCGTKARGKGMGITMTDKWFALEKLAIYSYSLNVI